MLVTSEASSTAKSPPGASRGRLLQVLGIWFGVAAAVGNTIGAGIVRTPGDVAKLLPNAWIFLGVWVLGGLYAFSGASSLAELSAAIPRSGGQYNFSRRALGEYAGFIVGWSDWLSTCGAAAAVAIVTAEYTGALFPALSGSLTFLRFSIQIESLVAVLAILGLFGLQWRGIRWGSGAQLSTAALKTAAFVILVIASFLLGGPAHRTAADSTASAIAFPSGWPLLVAIMLGLQAVIYTVDGWDAVVYFGEEVRNPGRDIPRAIFGSVFSIMGIYLLLNLAALYILPMSEISGNSFVLGAVADRIFGKLGDPIIRSIMLVSMLSCLNSNLLFSSRTLYSMSRDALFFRRTAGVNNGGTPVTALFLSTFAAVLFLLTGTFERVIAMLSFFFVANYALSYASLFILRRKEPQMARPYRAWGYPWLTGIALAASVLFLAGSILTDRQNAPWALAILVLSYPVFRVMRSVARRANVAAQKNS